MFPKNLISIICLMRILLDLLLNFFVKCFETLFAPLSRHYWCYNREQNNLPAVKKTLTLVFFAESTMYCQSNLILDDMKSGTLLGFTARVFWRLFQTSGFTKSLPRILSNFSAHLAKLSASFSKNFLWYLCSVMWKIIADCMQPFSTRR